jgi:hypothetical protein
MWRGLKTIAHTLPYDITIMSAYQKGQPLPAGRWSSVEVPALLLTGGKSPDWIKNAMHALADALPNAEERTLEGQTHVVKPKATAPALLEFFSTDAPTGTPG